jgi:hypothetical protein
MALGEKLFEESGEITGFKITRVHPIEGVTTEVSFTSDIRGEGRYPSGQSLGSGVMTKYPHGIIDGTWHGSLMIAEDASQFMWWAHEKSEVLEGGSIKGLNIMSGFTNSQKLSWMNNLVLALEIIWLCLISKIQCNRIWVEVWKTGLINMKEPDLKAVD